MLVKQFPQTQEINFDNRTKLTLRGVTKIEMGNWTHLVCGEKEYIVNPERILFVKVYKKKTTDYEVPGKE